MSMMKVHILRCGTVHLATGRSPFAPRVTLPVWCYLVEHPAQGLLLVDTGLGIQSLGPFLTWHYRCEPGPSITEQLNKRGFAPTELDAVILSDLDIDHTGGVHELRAAKRFSGVRGGVFLDCAHRVRCLSAALALGERR